MADRDESQVGLNRLRRPSKGSGSPPMFLLHTKKSSIDAPGAIGREDPTVRRSMSCISQNTKKKERITTHTENNVHIHESFQRFLQGFLDLGTVCSVVLRLQSAVRFPSEIILHLLALYIPGVLVDAWYWKQECEGRT